MTTESTHKEKHQRNEFSARWNTLWESFALVYYPMKKEESEQSMHDKYYKDAIQPLQNQRKKEDEKVLNKMREDFLRPHYQAIWQAVTLDEQLALFHLARDRFIHVKHPGINSLLCKGLIEFSPDLCLIDKRFEKFVEYVGTHDQLELIDSKHKSSPWIMIKVPLGISFLIFFMFLAITQEEFRLIFPALLSILPVFFQGMPELFNGASKKPPADTEKNTPNQTDSGA